MFKKTVLFLFLFLFCASLTFSLPTQRANCLEWSKNPVNATMAVTNYKVYWSDASGSFADANSYTTADATLTKVCFTEITALADPENKFYVVTAVNAGGESQFSNEVQLVPLAQTVPAVPGSLNLVVN